MIISKELRKSFGIFFIGIASFITTVIIAKPLLIEPSSNDAFSYILATTVVLICLLLGAMLLQTVKSNDEIIMRRSKGKRTFKFYKNTTFSVEEL